MGHVHGIDRTANRSLMLRAAATSMLLSLLFVLVYGSTNWFTAQRPSEDVQAWHFAWEAGITPYVPFMIVPYMSMDIFFFFAAFLCRNDAEIRGFARRVTFSIIAAAGFFLLLPLRLAWPTRPVVEGWFGDFVEQSSNAPFLMEYPHNLFPSLHIVLCMIVSDIYLRRTGGAVRAAAIVWFGLIAVSTLLTWQHHFVDILGGVILGAFAFWLFPDHAIRLQATRNPRVGFRYALGSAVLFAGAKALGVWGAFVLWPAFAMAIVASAYFGIGSNIYRKLDGRLHWSARFVFAPILLGQRLSLAYYRRQCRAWDEVVPGVLIGRVLDDAEASNLIELGVTSVLDMTAEFAESHVFLAAAYCNIAVLDLTAPTQKQLREAAAFICEESNRGIVYVHCKAGYSRSAAAVGAYLMASGKASTCDAVIRILRAARPSIVVREEIEDALRAFETSPQHGVDGMNFWSENNSARSLGPHHSTIGA